MAEQWKELGMTTTEEVIVATAAPRPLGPSFIDASNELSRRTLQMGTLARGHAVAQEINLHGPTAMLGEASRAIEDYNELHSMFVRVFSIYGGLLGALTDGPLWRRHLTLPPAADPIWQSWVQSRADALQYIDKTSQMRRAVAVYDLLTVDAFTVARSFPERSPDSIAWMRAAESLAARAEAQALAARQSELEMYRAVLNECLYGLEILRRQAPASPAHAAPSSMRGGQHPDQ